MTAANLGDTNANAGCVEVTKGAGKYTNSECTEEAVTPAKGEFEKHTISIRDKLPPGLKAVAVEGVAGRRGQDGCCHMLAGIGEVAIDCLLHVRTCPAAL